MLKLLRNFLKRRPNQKSKTALKIDPKYSYLIDKINDLKQKDEYYCGGETEFLYDNIIWAINYTWKISDGESIDDHTHCNICMRPMRPIDDIAIYESDDGFVCEYCNNHFLIDKNYK